MNPLLHLTIWLRGLRLRVIRTILSHRIQYLNPSMRCDPTAIWDYGFDDIDAIELGRDVLIGAYTEILVYKRTTHSSVRGGLVIGDRSAIQAGSNIRAAGGVIRVGHASAIGQNCVLVASNHKVTAGEPYFYGPWDELRTGITIGDNVWVGAGCVLLPGISIGDNALIAAGSVVTGDVPPNQIWGGVPARRIKDLAASGDSKAE